MVSLIRPQGLTELQTTDASNSFLPDSKNREIVNYILQIALPHLV